MRPFLADQPAQWGHQGMIKAKPNKRGVYAPSDWRDECTEKCKVSVRSCHRPTRRAQGPRPGAVRRGAGARGGVGGAWLGRDRLGVC